MERIPLVAGNWKMNKTVAETRRFILELRNKLLGIDKRVDVVVCPPCVSLEVAVDTARGTAIAIGAQNVFWEEEGAYTGEISPGMIEDLGARYVILGHSERRRLFGESDADVNRKLLRVMSHDLVPIVCLGESLDEREAGRTEAVVAAQVRGAVEGVAPDHARRLVVAYEPLWAIGTGRTASSGMANDVHGLIRAELAAIFDRSSADRVRVLYGGSVKPDNARDLMAEREIDGVLVGGASLDVASFAEIVGSAP
jgi:triosephosphate isomerase